MQTVVRYGADSSIALNLAPDALVAQCDAPRGLPLSDPAAAAAAVLRDPLEFPAVVRATVPGDRVALALDHAVPQAPAVIAGVVDALLEGPIEPDDIAIVRTGQDVDQGAPDPASLLPVGIRRAVRVITHDPTDRDELSYLAASEDGRPIYINRTVFDADFVLPIGCLRLEESFGYMGMHGGMFPTFSDEDAQKRFLAPSSVTSDVHHRRRCKEAGEVAWLLGIQCTVQVVPGGGENVLHVLGGNVDAVMARGRELCQEAWDFELPHRAALVVATIEGGREHQTWENFARALSASLRAVDDGGAVAVCTDLETAPGPALAHLTRAETVEAAIHQINRDRTADAAPASQLVQALDRVRVYLLSRLEEDAVEELGVAYVSNGEEIARLSRRHESCIVLANAQHLIPTARDQ